MEGDFYFDMAEKSVVASLASFTSCTRNMEAPFIKPKEFNTVVPFNASLAVVPSVL
jgi:hypothetical protein